MNIDVENHWVFPGTLYTHDEFPTFTIHFHEFLGWKAMIFKEELLGQVSDPWKACARVAKKNQTALEHILGRCGLQWPGWSVALRQCFGGTYIYIYTSSTAQGGGGSFKNRKPIGEIGCCESEMAERSYCWTERRLISLTLSLTIYLPTYLSSCVV